MNNIKFLKKIKNFETIEGINTFLNPYSIQLALKNPDIYNSFDSIYIDGEFLVKALNFLLDKKISRYSFDTTSLSEKIFSYCSRNNLSIYIVGSKKKYIKKTVEIFKKNHPNLNVINYREGYFSSNEIYNSTLKSIVEQNPDIVICGMGAPLQEKFLLDLKNNGWKGIGYTCGGFIHQTATKGINYYPYYINKLNLRWLYRIIDEPKLLKRYLLSYPKFMIWYICNINHIKRLLRDS